MSAEYSRSVLRMVVAQICQTIGWHSINSTPLEFMVDLMQEYILRMSRLTHQYAEILGRTEANLDDLGLAFKHMSVDIQDLVEYVRNVDSVSCPVSVPRFPVKRENHLNFLKPGSREVVTRPVYIHEHLPAMYPDTEEEYVSPEKPENPPSSPQPAIAPMNISPQRTSPSLFKRPCDPVSSDNPILTKKPKIHEEGSRPLREIHSVMMTTSGFLSPAREGKLPEARTPQQPHADGPHAGSYPMVPPELKIDRKKSIKKTKIGEKMDKENKKKRAKELFKPDKFVEKLGDKVPDKVGEKISDKMQEKLIDKAPDKLDKVQEKVSEKVGEKFEERKKLQGKELSKVKAKSSVKGVSKVSKVPKIGSPKVQKKDKTEDLAVLEKREENVDKLPSEMDLKKLNIFKKISKPREDKEKDFDLKYNKDSDLKHKDADLKHNKELDQRFGKDQEQRFSKELEQRFNKDFDQRFCKETDQRHGKDLEPKEQKQSGEQREKQREVESKYKDLESKDLKHKESESKDQRHKDSDFRYRDQELKESRYKDVELKESRHKDLEVGPQKYKDLESKDARYKDLDAKELKHKDFEVKEQRYKDFDAKHKDLDLRYKDSEQKDGKYKDSDLKDARYKDTEIKQKELELKESRYKDSEVKEQRYKDSDLKESKFKDTESKDQRYKDLEPKYKDTESRHKDTELGQPKYKDMDSKEFRHKDSELKDQRHKDTESKDSKHKDFDKHRELETKEQKCRDSESKHKEPESRESSPSLVIDLPGSKAPAAPVASNLPKPPHSPEYADSDGGSDVYCFDDMSPPGTPSTPRTPELSVPTPPVQEKKKKKTVGKRREKSPKGSPKKIKLAEQHDTDIPERPKTPQAPSPQPPLPSTLPFPFFPTFPAPGLIPHPMFARFPLPMTRGAHPAMPNLPLPPPRFIGDIARGKTEKKKEPVQNQGQVQQVQQNPQMVFGAAKTKEKNDKKSKEHKKEKKEKLKKKKDKKEKHKEKGEKIKDKKEKGEKKEKLEKIKEKKEKKDKRKEKEEKEEKSAEAVPKLTLRLGTASPRPPTPESTPMKKITIKTLLKKPEEEPAREPSPELVRISALVTRPPKQRGAGASKGTTGDGEGGQSRVKKSLFKGQSDPSASKLPTPAQPQQPAYYFDQGGHQVWICPACGNQDDGSPMVGCDDCDAWYHWVCVGMQVPPADNEDWYCRFCIAKKQELHHDKKKKKRKKKVKVNA